MTAQSKDIINYNDHRYFIFDVQHPEMFFNINGLGITPRYRRTSCWRGFVAEFSICKNNLVLKNLDTNNDGGNAELIVLNGISPIVEHPRGKTEQSTINGWYYKDVNLLLPYLGAILIESDNRSDGNASTVKDAILICLGILGIEIKFENGHFLEANNIVMHNLPEWIEERHGARLRMLRERMIR